ncbi:alpha-tubulin N-acetyltransferase 1 isoform X1 [Drosophila novamexicana]|uniref:alpha-tubulin N-acetyltransferase 1 isoform X1 n=1 Tax=Drosophila novamexicana TaxID=47314 RepID=UPI0011E5CF95|nr:alpha-tubulin N-acetyltransferase 1 isoform X1 [Drosophila novamexicana]XP_030570357.1 alpha-tubulin N-acetyltransferase 1 isoform X1 [Drosophila novamexicana]
MVDFRFDIKPLFPQPIIKVTSNLLPHTFRGDRRQCLDATSKMSEIIDRLGQLSATSQGLNKPVTTAQRLRMSENQTIYLLADPEAGNNGCVIGLLKVGTKDLYLFDEKGQTRKMEQSPSILDFYVHETRQRAGLGKRLFETMLSEEQWTPPKCSVDRPSEKLLAFLGKHYGLVRTIPQANNFVLYEGFFNDAASQNGSRNGHADSPQRTKNGLHITNSPNTQLFGATYLGDEADHQKRFGRRNSNLQQQHQHLQQPSLLQQITQISPNGRYGAPRPTCSMAEIIHSGSGSSSKGGGGGSSESNRGSDIAQLTAQFQNLQAVGDAIELYHLELEREPEPEPEPEPVTEEVITPASPPPKSYTPTPPMVRSPEVVESIIGENRKPPAFQLSKQHTGMKNRSSGVGMAVMPSDKMEFNQPEREDFGVVKINRPLGNEITSPGQDNTDAMSIVSSTAGLTDQGFNDLKFYHNKLW